MRDIVTTGVVVLLLLVSGCVGLGPGEPQQTMPQSATSTATSLPTSSCTAEPPRYNLSRPSKPDALTEARARSLATTYERRYKRARLVADFGAVTIDRLSWRKVTVEPISGGFAVRVQLAVHFSTTNVTGKQAYPTTYRITNRRFVRANRTLACWSID
ncbi:hypothetical protein [Halosegnis sp.]|uniref:hypothetical protein n=1 Tax=Halosegnis sp. TaxID=2864959 RepID=UPI0035D44605